MSLAPFQGALTAFITGAIFQEMGLPTSPGLLALALPSLSINRGKIGGPLSPPHTFPPPGGLPPPASPCRFYAVILGDPPQLYAGYPAPQTLPGPSCARRTTIFSRKGPAPLPEGVSGRPPRPRSPYCWSTTPFRGGLAQDGRTKAWNIPPSPRGKVREGKSKAFLIAFGEREGWNFFPRTPP